MENHKSKNLEYLSESIQELTINEQLAINGGSAISYAAGWLLGAYIGLASWMGVEG